MSKPIIKIVDCASGEVIEREMNAAEFKQYEENVKSVEKQKAEAESKAIAKAVLLEKLGITAEEAVLLLS